MVTGAEGTVLTDDEPARYRRGSAALREGGSAVDGARLKNCDRRNPTAIDSRTRSPRGRSPRSRCSGTVRRPPLFGAVGQALVRLSYHKGYHNGQIGLLRRMAGKESAIKQLYRFAFSICSACASDVSVSFAPLIMRASSRVRSCASSRRTDVFVRPPVSFFSIR